MKLYKGIVEDRYDPNKVGRVRVRIPNKDADLDIQSLDWYNPVIPFASGYDYGSLIIPEVGSIVWVLIDDSYIGDSIKLYLGGAGYGIGTILDNKKLGDKLVPKNKVETPEESLREYPLSSTIYKDLKETSISVNSQGDLSLYHGPSKSVINLSEQISMTSGASTLYLDKDSMSVSIGNSSFNLSDGASTLDTINSALIFGDGVSLSNDKLISISAGDNSIKLNNSEDKIIIRSNSGNTLELNKDKISISNLENKNELSIDNNKINIKFGNSTNIDLDENNIDLIKGSNKISISNSGIVIDGNVTINGTLINSGVNITTHTHECPDGGGTSSSPQ